MEKELQPALHHLSGYHFFSIPGYAARLLGNELFAPFIRHALRSGVEKVFNVRHERLALYCAEVKKKGVTNARPNCPHVFEATTRRSTPGYERGKQ